MRKTAITVLCVLLLAGCNAPFRSAAPAGASGPGSGSGAALRLIEQPPETCGDGPVPPAAGSAAAGNAAPDAVWL